MNNKCIVVTGGAGFIGSNLVKELEKENRIIVIDDLSTGNIQNIKNFIDEDRISFIKGSITDLNLLKKIFKNVDYVFHTAAIPSVPKSIKDPIKSNYININGTLNVLIAARDTNVNKVVYSSSSSIYGDTPKLPKKEDMKPKPQSPYAVSKLTGEYYCNVFTGVYDLPTICLRYFNVYGPNQNLSGEYAAVIPKFLKNITQNKPPIIYGDGKQTRDFTFVKDVVTANILSVKNKQTGIFNIASGRYISINNLAKLINEKIGKDIKPIYENTRVGDILYSFADISKANKKLGYSPKFNLKDGIKETTKWFQNQMYNFVGDRENATDN
jgi:UDP-glucose 4-epimerase